MRCSPRDFLCVCGTVNDEQHEFMLVLPVRRLRRYSFVYLSVQNFQLRFNAFCRAPFGLAIFLR